MLPSPPVVASTLLPNENDRLRTPDTVPAELSPSQPLWLPDEMATAPLLECRADEVSLTIDWSKCELAVQRGYSIV